MGREREVERGVARWGVAGRRTRPAAWFCLPAWWQRAGRAGRVLRRPRPSRPVAAVSAGRHVEHPDDGGGGVRVGGEEGRGAGQPAAHAASVARAHTEVLYGGRADAEVDVVALLLYQATVIRLRLQPRGVLLTPGVTLVQVCRPSN